MTPPAADVARLVLTSESPGAGPSGLVDLPGVDRVEDVDVRPTTTTYYDTPDLRLTRDGAVLCRLRTGGHTAAADGGDDGSGEGAWSLRLPGLQRSAEDGDEVPTEPLGVAGEAPPARLAGLARAYVRGAPLVPVATVHTRGRTRRLMAADGTPLGELHEQDLEAQGAFGPPHRRRLVTVSGADDSAAVTALRQRLAERGELGDDGDDAAGDTEVKADGDGSGAGRAGADSLRGLYLALGPSADAEPDVPLPPTALKPGRPAAQLVAADLRSHVRALLEWEAPVQLDRYDAVHKMRVSVRRLRSSLRTFGPLLDPATIARLEPELHWLADSLGRPRDAEVMRDRLAELAGALPGRLRVGGAERALADTLADNHRAARETLMADLDSPRGRQLLVDVVALAARPPLLSEAQRPIDEVVPRLLRRAWHKLDRRVQKAQSAEAALSEQKALADQERSGPDAAAATDGSGDADGTAGTGSFEARAHEADEALHTARKAAKQLRYAAEAGTRVYGRRAERLAGRAEAVQEVLGEHQDSVVSQHLLVELAEGAARSGQDTFTYGVLAGDERGRAERSRQAFGPVWKEASRKRHRRWLST